MAEHPNGPFYVKTMPIRARQIHTEEDIAYAKERANNPKDAVVGNYLVTGHRGCNYIIKKEIFEEIYTLA